MKDKYRDLIEKTIAVIVGYFVTLPFFYFITDPIVLSLTLLAFFTVWYWLFNQLFVYVRKRRKEI